MFDGKIEPSEGWRAGKKPKPKKTSPQMVRDFRLDHGLEQDELDNLMGFFSDGRATRRWEADGAPYYITILMAYADRYGLDVMRELATARDQ